MNRLTVLFLLVILTGWVPARAASADCPAQPLEILLTNDDGFDRPGIHALRTTLTNAGHKVTIAAPDRNYSGGSASLTTGDVTLRDHGARVYAIGGTPATAVLLALDALYPGGRPDLLVSGINEGANLGSAEVASGTVGAAISAITLAVPPLPAIAVSTDLVGPDVHSTANQEHFADVAEFTGHLVERLNAKACGSPLLPERTALNVNYPARARANIQGVRLTRPGRQISQILHFEQIEPGIYRRARIASPDDGQPQGNDDVTLHRRGFITISVLDGSYGARPAGTLKHLRALSP